MKKLIHINMLRSLMVVVCMFGAASLLWISCDDELSGKTFLTTDDLMIDDYITQKDPSMTGFLEIADKAGFRGMIHAYGTYTCFVPTNEGVNSYLQSLGKSSISDLSVEECELIIKYHVVRDTLRTSDFIDGRLNTANMRAKYLTTKVVDINGSIYTQVNRQALILQANIRAANGYIHKIDQVLIPPALTTGEQIQNLPDEYSIFKKVMSISKWDEVLTNDKADGVWYSVFLQSDEAFAKKGIYSDDDLIAQLQQDRPDITDIDSLLWTFAAYSCVKGLYYIADLSVTSALQSQAPNQAITFKLSKDTILVNEYIPTMGIKEPGVPINKQSEYTDYSCYNGVLLDLSGYIGPKRRSAQAVYWDVAEQPELLKNSLFRKAGTFNIAYDELSEIKMELAASSYGEFRYECRSAYEKNWQPVNMDYLVLRWYRLVSMEMTLPLLTEGEYNVWVCWRRADVTTCRVRATFVQEGQDEQPLNIISFADNFNTSSSADALLAAGMKRYTAKDRTSTMNSRLYGTIVVQSTGRHTLRFDVIDRGRNADIYLDMIQFIPVEEDQLWPRFDMKGNAIYPGTPCEGIWPSTNTSCPADNDAK